jgi:transcriptional regulator with XRE-family HTH domain
MEIGAQFGRSLAAQRMRAGLSQEELADRADMHRTAISLSETGKRVPRLDTLLKLAGALGVSVGTLVDGISFPGSDISSARSSICNPRAIEHGR